MKRTVKTNISERDSSLMNDIAQRRDQLALRALFEFYGPRLKGWLIARGAGPSTAEDILQDVMIKVWTHAQTFDASKASFATWVYRMTRNKWIDHQRKHGRVDVRDPELMKVIADDTVVSAEEGFQSDQEAAQLREKMQRLPDDQRKLIMMAFMEFKTHKEIANETDIPLGTVKTRIRRGLQTIKLEMERDNDI